MKKKHFISALILTGLLFTYSCSGDGGTDTPDPDPDPTGKTTYTKNIKGIISNNCGNCHGNPTANGAPVSFDTYSKVKAAVDKIITRTNSSSNPMPAAGLMSQTNRDLIKKWKTDGLIE